MNQRLDHLLATRICLNCHQPLPEDAHGSQKFCNRNCQASHWQRSKRNQGKPASARAPRQKIHVQAKEEQRVQEIQELDQDELETATDALTESIDKLIHAGFLPQPTIRLAVGSVPVWSFPAIAALFELRPDQLAEVLVANGKVHGPEERGIPSSWHLFQTAEL